MFDKMINAFIKNADNPDDPKVREKCGKLSGITGIILNAALSALKIAAGAITGAISVLSDGVNNLSDAGSSVITLLGFKLSAKKPDKEHPFGHGRMEYFTGLAVSAVILVIAVQLFITSLEKVIAGETLSFKSRTIEILTIVILAVSVAVKLFMAAFNRALGKKINSLAMKATASDSLNDAVATAVVLICTVLSRYTASFPLDGAAGILVSLFIAYTGVSSMKGLADLLLGSAPDKQLVKEITDYALNFDKQKIIGVHDLMINDYGPSRKLIILHAEVPKSGDVMQLHDAIDNLEHGLQNKFGGLAVIHMDPVDTDSPRVNELREKVREIVKELDKNLDIHDFRMNEGDTHANLIFDLVVPYDFKIPNDRIRNFVTARIAATEPKCNVIMKIENSFTD